MHACGRAKCKATYNTLVWQHLCTAQGALKKGGVRFVNVKHAGPISLSCRSLSLHTSLPTYSPAHPHTFAPMSTHFKDLLFPLQLLQLCVTLCLVCHCVGCRAYVTPVIPGLYFYLIPTSLRSAYRWGGGVSAKACTKEQQCSLQLLKPMCVRMSPVQCAAVRLCCGLLCLLGRFSWFLHPFSSDRNPKDCILPSAGFEYH